ncbi:hypothetical protein B0I35DRAFT_64860 [Stachybotrys elegans]|uniref:Uncharacterized protein n=1 Tax=Stachybotrys elegans TaxID=80388 RepID=A0A8K0WP57_9HYPO|nr:hypothetical protein B0I35DRAFT_64860 [Stachybotrys elegans]
MSSPICLCRPSYSTRAGSIGQCTQSRQPLMMVLCFWEGGTPFVGGFPAHKAWPLLAPFGSPVHVYGPPSPPCRGG